MTRSSYQQANQVCPYDYSGFRAIDMDFLRPLYDVDAEGHERWNEAFDYSSWGLEVVLESLCPKEQKRVIKIIGLKSKKRGGKVTHTHMHNERSLAYSKLIRLGLVS